MHHPEPVHERQNPKESNYFSCIEFRQLRTLDLQVSGWKRRNFSGFAQAGRVTRVAQSDTYLLHSTMVPRLSWVPGASTANASWAVCSPNARKKRRFRYLCAIFSSRIVVPPPIFVRRNVPREALHRRKSYPCGDIKRRVRRSPEHDAGAEMCFLFLWLPNCEQTEPQWLLNGRESDSQMAASWASRR